MKFEIEVNVRLLWKVEKEDEAEKQVSFWRGKSEGRAELFLLSEREGIVSLLDVR
jgi:hypothetical protein